MTVLTSDKVADHTWRDPNVVIVVGGSSGARAPPERRGRGGGRGDGWYAGRTPAYPARCGAGRCPSASTRRQRRAGPAPGTRAGPAAGAGRPLRVGSRGTDR